jgi:hypothetical protein
MELSDDFNTQNTQKNNALHEPLHEPLQSVPSSLERDRDIDKELKPSNTREDKPNSEIPHANQTNGLSVELNAACRALQAMGIPLTNPSHPDLTALIAKGVRTQDLCEVAMYAKTQGKTAVSYILAIAKNQLTEKGKVGRMAFETSKQKQGERPNQTATQAAYAKALGFTNDKPKQTKNHGNIIDIDVSNSWHETSSFIALSA